MTTRNQLEPRAAGRHVRNGDCGMKNQYIAKLRDCVVEKFVRENLTTSNSFLAHDHDQLTRLVEQRIMNMFPDFHTPDHPTYAFMIRRAITELNDECRTDKESISEFIREEYNDLPVAHERVLMFQLNKLCEKGEILLSAVGCYLLPVGDYFQQKIPKKENGEKKRDGVGDSVIKGGNFKGNVAVDGTREGECCSRQMNGRKRKGNEGMRTRSRWSRRLQSYGKLQVDEANKNGSGIVEDITRSSKRGGKNGTSGYQTAHIELPASDHRKDQHIEIFEDPFEPPGFPSRRDQLILQKQPAGTDLQAFEIGAEVEQRQEENNEMKSDTSQHFDGGNISGFGEHHLIKPSCEEPLQLGTGRNVIIEAPATALDNDSLRLNDMDVDLHDNRSAEIAHVLLLSGEQGRPAADDCVLSLNQTTRVELSTLRKEEAAGSSQCQGLGTCTDNVPDQQVLNATREMALEYQQTFRTEVVSTPANPTPDACPAALNSQPDDDQHLKKQDTPMHRGRGRPPKTSNGFPIMNEKPKKKDGRGRPRKEKSDDLPEPTTDVEVEQTSKKTDDPPDREVAGTKYMQQNSNSANVCILALKSLSQYKEGSNKRKRVERPSKIDNDDASETMDFPEAKKGRGKGIKKSCYTDISITDLIYSQDHLLQPMTRFRGRPRKL